MSQQKPALIAKISLCLRAAIFDCGIYSLVLGGSLVLWLASLVESTKLINIGPG